MRKATLINSQTKGVLDVSISDRYDLVHYYAGLSEGLNCSGRPQGSTFRRPGTMMASGMDLIAAGTKRRIRRRMQPIALTAGMVTVANGGLAARLVGQDLATGDDFVSNSVSGATFVLAELDLGSVQSVAAVDIENFRCATSGADNALAVEYSDGVNWFALDGRRHIRSTSTLRRTRRFATPPGGVNGVPISTRYLRVVLYGATGTGAFTIGRLRAWREKRAVSPDRVLTFARGKDVKYEMVLTDRNIDVFKNHRWVAALPVPVDASQIRRIKDAQSIDTLHLYHEDVRTAVIQRQGFDTEWNAEGATFTNQPSLSPAMAFSGDTDEIQDVSLAGIVNGQSFVLWVDDEVTAPIAFSGTGSLASDISAALNALPALSAAPTVSLVDATSRTVSITFAGALGARRWAPVLPVVLDDDVLSPYNRIVQRGIDSDGLLASPQTGWPRCGLFNQSRHIMAGFRSAPQSIMTSRHEQLYDLKTTGTLTADLAFIDTLDTDQTETVYELIVGKHLQALTESGAWFMEARTLDATQPRNWRLAARPGVDPAVPVMYLDEATLFMQSGEQRPGMDRGASRVMRELLLLSNVEAAYASEPKNLLAPHLITDAVDFAALEPRDPKQGARGYVVNADGSVAHLVTQRTQEVVGYYPWQTDGKFSSVGVDLVGNVWATIERTGANGADKYLERLDDETTLDATMVYAFDTPTATLLGLDHLAGKTNVWAYVDGDLWGPLTVTAGGQCTLPQAGLDVRIGLFSEWTMAPMPIRDKLNESQPFRPPGRLYELEISCIKSGPFDLSVNGGPAQEVAVTYLGDQQFDGGPFQSGGEMDLPLLERLFTGSILIDRLLGFSRHPRWRLSQSKPAPVEITAARSEIAFRG